jgi:hypothetical protein
MDSETLVIERIDAGARFLALLEKYLPVKVAFWLKAAEETKWFLYVASDQVNDATRGAHYEDVGRAVKVLDDPNFNSFRVKLLSADQPLARAALERSRQASRWSGPVIVNGGLFGGMSVAEVYIYPPPPYDPRWRGVSIMVFSEGPREDAYRVEFWPREPAAMIVSGGPPKKVPRPAGVRVESGRVTEFRPPEKPLPDLTQEDYERKALEAVTQVADKGDGHPSA